MRQVAATLQAMRNKTDRNDARGLAQILRTGWSRTVHVKSVASHQARALLSSRKVVISKFCDLENELRGLLKVFGVRLPMRGGSRRLRCTVTRAVAGASRTGQDAAAAA
jgi:transposase